jgi:hypothetical protein
MAFHCRIPDDGDDLHGVVWRTNPALLIARSRGFHTETKRWDKVLLAILFPLLLAIWPIAALDDGRCHWSALPWGLSACGSLLLLRDFGW